MRGGPRPVKSCFEKAVELLGRRAHFRRELDLKLARRGYSREEIAATLDRLQELKYLDEERTAEAFVEARAERAPAGRPLMRSELVRRGAARTVVEGALEGVDEAAAAKEAAERFLRRRQRPGESQEDRQKALLRHLASRGFPGHLVRKVMDQIGSTLDVVEEAFEIEDLDLDPAAGDEAEGRSG